MFQQFSHPTKEGWKLTYLTIIIIGKTDLISMWDRQPIPRLIPRLHSNLAPTHIDCRKCTTETMRQIKNVLISNVGICVMHILFSRSGPAAKIN